MSDKKASGAAIDSSDIAEAVAVTEHMVHFVPSHPKPEDSHKQALLEAVGQMFEAGSSALYFDPSSAGMRISIPTATGLHEIISLPLAVGRQVIEAIRQETTIKEDPGGGVHGPFAHGVMRVEQGGAERRLNVDLIPTVYGAAAVLRLMPALPATSGDLLGMGLSQTQAPLIETLLTSGSGLMLLGGPDRDWVANTCSVLLSKAALLGRRPVMVASRAGADMAGVARVEAGRDPADTASAIARLAAADYSCIGVENFLSEDVARAASAAVNDHKTLVLGICGGRSAPETVSQFYSLGLPGPINAALALATCQIQIPLLCPKCAKWGDVSSEDIAYFGLDPTKQTNFFVRTGCTSCSGQITEFAQTFEIAQITDALREKIRMGLPFARLEGELTTMPGYVKLLHRFGEVIQEGKSSAAEARHYYMWQIPNAPRSIGAAPSGGNMKAV